MEQNITLQAQNTDNTPVDFTSGRRMLSSYALRENARYFQGKKAGTVDLKPILNLEQSSPRVEFRIGISTQYVVKDLSEFAEQMRRHARVRYGKKLEFMHHPSAFTTRGLLVVQMIMRILDELEEAGSPLLQNQEQKRFLPLSVRNLEELLSYFEGDEVLVQGSRLRARSVNVCKGNPPLVVEILKTDEGLMIQTEYFQLLKGLNRLIVQMGDKLYLCSEEFSEDCRYFLEECAASDESRLYLSHEDLQVFGVSVLPILQNYFQVDITEGLLNEFMPDPAQIKIYIEPGQGVDLLRCRVESQYGETVYNAFDPVQIGKIYRDVARESAAVQAVHKLFPHVMRGERCFAITEEDELYEFLEEGTNNLEQIGEVWMDESVREFRIGAAPRLSVGVSLKNDLLNLTISSEEMPFDEVSRLLENYRLKKRYFRLKDGSFLRLEDNSLQMISELLEGLHLPVKNLNSRQITLPRFRAAYLDAVLSESGEGVQINRDAAFRAFVRQIKSVAESEFEVPTAISSWLRLYQKVGYRWMRTMDAMGFGGLLADDMGLGKTIEVIALLESYHEEESPDLLKPVLIVCPASLVYNWESELTRFSPSLPKMVISGSQNDRAELITRALQIPGCILITSYDLLKRDFPHYEEVPFRYQILDEAQMIKNHMTQAARVVKKIMARTRFALTGTPVENRLSELWSIFDYLMPGMLYTYPRFQKDLETPIVREQDERAMHRLKQMIHPFILRRLKSDVLKELPDKEEMMVYAGMEEKQRELYDLNVQQLRGTLDREGEANRIQILAQLMRLRQICCDPSLVYENYKDGSAKLEACIHLVSEAVEGGHKVLLFSQFTSMLDILAERLTAENLSYYMLTGSVSKEKRAQMVRDFHVDTTDVFLISLKAGGTGLNLTAADIVIHFDPWWNLAAENQATDRAYRIGQKNKVTVYRLIMKDTIEDRIVQMQEDKQHLSDQVITEEGFPAAYLTEDVLREMLQ